MVPHTDERLDYGYGTVVQQPVEADAIVITGSRRNVSMWEPWMDQVVALIRGCEVPLYGICFRPSDHRSRLWRTNRTSRNGFALCG